MTNKAQKRKGSKTRLPVRRLRRLQDYVWCQGFGEIHANTLDPYGYGLADHCRPEDHRAVYTRGC